MKRFLAAVMLAWTASAAGAAESLVLYLNEDGERVRAAFGKLRQAVAERPGLRRHAVRLEHVVVDPAGDPGSLRAAVRAAAARAPAAIIAASGPIAQAANEEAPGIAVLFGIHQDPVDLRLASSYRRPGGHATGLTLYRGVDEKRLELLREIAPASRRLGIVVDKWWDLGPEYRHPSSLSLERVARERFGFEVHLFRVGTRGDLARLSADPQARRMDVWFLPGTQVGFDHPGDFTRTMAGFRKPAIYSLAMFAEAGGLLSYQQIFENPFATWAKMLDLILDGFPAGEIPIERPRIFELAVNTRAAREQGIALPKSILLRATHFY